MSEHKPLISFLPARAFRDAPNAALDCGHAEVEGAAMERSSYKRRGKGRNTADVVSTLSTSSHRARVRDCRAIGKVARRNGEKRTAFAEADRIDGQAAAGSAP